MQLLAFHSASLGLSVLFSHRKRYISNDKRQMNIELHVALDKWKNYPRLKVVGESRKPQALR